MPPHREVRGARTPAVARHARFRKAESTFWDRPHSAAGAVSESSSMTTYNDRRRAARAGARWRRAADAGSASEKRAVGDAWAFLDRLEALPWHEVVTIPNYWESWWTTAYFECLRAAWGSLALRRATRDLLDRVNRIRSRGELLELARGVVVGILARQQPRADRTGDHEGEYQILTEAFAQALPRPSLLP